jgi:hypothetical protein
MTLACLLGAGVNARAAEPAASLGISGPLSTVKADHPRYLMSTLRH